MRLLITGASGMLGANLCNMLKDSFHAYGTSRNNYNGNKINNYKIFNLLEDDYSELLEWAKPDCVIHCGAITDIDYCQREKRKAMYVNGHSVRKFMKLKFNFKLIYISSDAVYGKNTHMACINDFTKPLNIYGESKLLGEQYCTERNKVNTVLRVTIIGRNLNESKMSFTEWIVNSVKNKESITLTLNNLVYA